MTRKEAIFELIKYRRMLEKDSTIDAEPFDMAIEALENNDKLAEDLQNCLEMYKKKKAEVEALERKRGEWIETSESIGWEEVECAECSVCGKTLVLGDYTMDDIKFDYNYCPNCGADMRGDKDER